MRTQSKIILAALLGVCSLLPALFIRSVSGFFPACALAAVALCALFSAVWGLFRLKGTVETAQTRPMRGDACRLSFCVENRSPFPLPFVAVTTAVRAPGGVTLRETHTAALAPGQALRFELQAVLPHVGPCTCGIERLAVRDLTGLFTLHRRGWLSAALVAAPRIEGGRQADTPGSQRVQHAERPMPTRAASGLYGGVRGYAAGDPLRGIHWKLTAHTGDLMSRVYEGAPKPPFYAVMDLSPGTGAAAEFDLLIEQPLGIALDALESGYDVSLLCETDGAPHAHSPQGARELAALGRLLAERPGRAADAAQLLGALPHASGQVFLCTARLTDALQGRLLALARQGARLSVLWVTDLAPEERAQRMEPLTRAGIELRAVQAQGGEPSPARQAGPPAAARKGLARWLSKPTR